jgi:chromosome segregation ATPase
MLGTVLAVLAGCETSEGRQAKVARRAVTSLEGTREQLIQADQQVDAALASMDRLAAQPRDLKQSYRAYAGEVSKTVEEADEAEERADEMRERWQEYITSWEQEADRIRSDQLRAGATERRQSVRDNYNRLRDVANNTRQAYEPFLRQLQDIQRALSLDLTPAGVEAAKPAMETARQTGAQLKEQIDAFIQELDSVSAARATQPTPSESVAGTEP